MTRYRIRLQVEYDYASPATGGRHLLRMLPRDVAGVQQVEQAHLAVSPRPTEREDFSDFFGNPASSVAITAEHSRIVFTATAVVARSAGAVTRPAVDLGADSPLHYMAPSPRITPVESIATFAARAVAGATGAEAVRAFGLALYRDMRFDAKATTVDTPPEEAFAARHGVCQDFAQIMISGLRSLGIPAGYVSGFLRTVPPAGQARLEGADAMHAWVRAWADGNWVEFDPTNGCLVAQDHIVVAYGRDYGDVAPVAGVMRGAGGQATRQGVDVVPLD